ncbi:CLUMA_CG003163, isoform A [Clunio marinus]|uniref:CLUMA_CG003163, isoform A n=1 Tax=Clunio marinus TaxID=568069 RepID=A0A1J1HSF8_9DIPT|nr:CLUMA_CG003163, isoform A [Clunio marinus]
MLPKKVKNEFGKSNALNLQQLLLIAWKTLSKEMKNFLRDLSVEAEKNENLDGMRQRGRVETFILSLKQASNS